MLAAGERKTLSIGTQVTDQHIVIAELNIAHFRKKLATEQDAEKRALLLRLLAEEESKLASLKCTSDESNTNKN
jgi:hypothetical protein